MSGREQPGFQEVVNLLNNLVTVATAPGIIVHEFGHYAAARLLGATVQEVTFFQLEDGLFGRSNTLGRVRHSDVPETGTAVRKVIISLAPIVISVLAAALTIIAGRHLSGVSQYICVWFAFAFLLHAVPSPRDVENVELRADRLPAPLRPVVRIGTSLLGPVQTVILVAQIGILQGIGLLVFEISVETSTLVSMAGFYLGGALGIIVLFYGYDLIRGRRRIRDDIARFRSADMRRATRLRDRAERGPDAAIEALPEIVALLSSDSTPVQIGAVQALVSAVESDPIAVATYDDDIATVIETGSDERVLRLLLITVEALAEELVERDGETEAEKTGTTLSPVLVDAVVRSLAVEQPEVRTAAARALSKIDRTEGADISDAVPALLACARMEDASDNNRAFAALSGVAGQRPDLLRQHEEWVTARLESEDVLDRVSAIGILGGTFAIDALDRLRKVKADDEEPPVRLVADQTIHRLDPLREAVDRIRSAADGGPGTDSTGGG